MTARTGTGSLPTRDRLLSLIAALDGRPVLVVADLVLDRYLYGAPKRISREAPVLILQLEREEQLPGGGANAAVNVRALGGAPLVVGRVGDDAAGVTLAELLSGRGIQTGLVERTPGTSTPTKSRVLGGASHTLKQQIVRFDVGDEQALPPEQFTRMGARLAAALEALPRRPTVAVLSDYGYGAAAPGWVPVLRRVLSPGALVLVDSRYRCGAFAADAATPNQEEAEAIVGRPLAEPAQIVAAAPQLLGERAFLLVTRGSQGMALIERGDRHSDSVAVTLVPAAGSHQVTDVTGAGDTVMGAFALALAAGGSPLEAALLANFAGGVVVGKPGTATSDREELASAVSAGAGTLEGTVVRRAARG